MSFGCIKKCHTKSNQCDKIQQSWKPLLTTSAKMHKNLLSSTEWTEAYSRHH